MKIKKTLLRFIDRHIVAMLIIFSVLVTTTVFWQLYKFENQIIEALTLDNAASLSNTLVEFRTLYTSEVVIPARKAGLKISHDYKNKAHTIPLPATLSMLLGNKMSENEDGGNSLLYSPFPFPWRVETGGLNSEFSRNAWVALNLTPDQPYFRIEKNDGKLFMRYAVADVMRPQCVDCHNSHPDTPKNDWKTGDVRGILEVISPMNRAVAITRTSMTKLFTLLGWLAVFGIALSYLAIKSLRTRKDEAQKAEQEAILLNVQKQQYTSKLELAHMKAIDAQKAAEKASLSKSDFLANMSHEIRTPMNGVLGMTELLLDTKMSSEQTSWVNIIRKSGENLLNIINDILDFSKIEAGMLNIEPKNFSLYTAVEEVTDLLQMVAQEKGLEFLVEFAPDTPEFVVGDPGRVRQIIFNLAGNAIKFTKSGHVLIKISGKREKNNMIRLYFGVIDTGIGISKDKQSYVFGKFSQAEESTTRKFGGTGLGLTICKSLVEMMGGTIGMLSKAGSGSTFYFDLILPLGVKEENKGSTPDFNLKNVRCLIVGDYKPNRENIRQQLQQWDMKCDIFSVTTDALQAMKQAVKEKDPYHICLVIDNPGKTNGIAFAKKINALKSLQNTKVIMIGAAGNDSFNQQLKEKGIDSFMAKPVYLMRLKEVVKVLLHSRQQQTNIPLITRHYIVSALSAGEARKSGKLKQFKGKTALAVEDMKMNLILITKLLSKYGLQVDTAVNGLLAVEKIQKTKYDIVFMDCQMPEMDGFEATGEIRKNEKNSDSPRTTIVALTADAMTGDRDKCLKAGMDDYLNKPVRGEEISDMLSKWIPMD